MELEELLAPGTCEPVDASREEWEVELTDPEMADEWFMTPLVLDLRDLKPLKKGECYSATCPRER